MRLKFVSVVAAAVISLSASMPNSGGVDVADALAFSNIKKCDFTKATEAVFKTMLSQVGESRRWKTVPKISLGAVVAPTKRKVFDKNDIEPGGKFYEVEAVMPPGTLWHGLHLARIDLQQSDYTEVDNFAQRQLIFLDPPEKVQAVMKLLGVSVPFSPKYRDFGDEDEAYGAMFIIRQKNGAAFGCNWSA